MKQVADMSVEELAGLVCETLATAGITTTLTGGACVAIWSEGKYVSRDLDFIEEGPVSRRRVKDALRTIGFKEKDRYFINPETDFYVEFPTGPLTVGDERVYDVEKIDTGTGHLRLLTPTDCVKDRLAAFFHWRDEMALEQALLVAREQPIDIEDLRRWASAEGETDKLATFENALGRDRLAVLSSLT
ncbi:MAG: hypothetical protein V2I25_00035 [Woeseiaceae bacterium]|nr:hypothetical protein [Woeseiaceae bacterium]